MPLRRPHPLVALVTLLFVALTLHLGFWQLGRGDRKAAKIAAIEAADKRVAQTQITKLTETSWQQRYLLRGQWQPSAQIYLDNRILQGRAGFHVLTPLQLEDGRWLLVNRGWLPKQYGVEPHSAAPLGMQQVLLRLQAPNQRYMELAADSASGMVWQNLDWTRFQSRFDKPLVPALALQLTASDSLIRDWSPPADGVLKHYSYAGQWFLFAATAVFLFLFLHRKKRA